ncbi:asparagine synthase-domain-containing protein [Massariosphaeria phaeospora]|uniref:Asparagine synthase-domain-containing protein n=1 Tax=Massariosphaeria phaeospora TaxID=100035 RepID=A0A7C8M8C7_9PLEO|nr:asparagine synthase-domain-containing protein [Massariosphaeria phaeospora]
MCGIFFSLSRKGYVPPDPTTAQRLKNRGPDSSGQHQTLIPATAYRHPESTRLHATFFSTVLSLRGTALVEQPLRDDASGSILCWNGEAWSVDREAVSGNDSRVIFDLFLRSCAAKWTDQRIDSIARTIQVISAIRGPFAFVFYDAMNHHLYYARDCLGRRSLLRKSTSEHELVLSSVCDSSAGSRWGEVEADGLYVLDLQAASSGASFDATHFPHRRRDDNAPSSLTLTLPFPDMNKSGSDSGAPHIQTEILSKLRDSLQQSLALRVHHIREATGPGAPAANQDTKLAILFSGGLDCTILARMSHGLLPLGETIDLLNVAFENPRIHAKLDVGTSPYDLCPDRITARSSHAELERVCPGRCWRLVEINVPYTDTAASRSDVMTLMHPHNTEMDLSIAYALYFASRGTGIVRHTNGLEEISTKPYQSTAHVLLSGLGADELFGGYQRHAIAFSRQGHLGIVGELELDFNRLGKRNLGRDDRVISDSGKEVRFPYLDENFIALVLELPVSAKCDFATPQMEGSDDPARFLEPGKRVLRLLAWDLGMRNVAAEKKRAIQFGARTAKMETGKTKGTHLLTC